MKKPLDPDGPMTRKQQKKLNAMCGDMANQVDWPVDGVLRRMHKDDWRLLMVSTVLRQPIASGVDGGPSVVLGRSSKELTVRTAQTVLDLLQHLGDSKSVNWSDENFQSQMRQAAEFEH